MPPIKRTYTWDDLYKRAENCRFGSPELRAKDEARFQLADLIEEEWGYDIENGECAEEEIDYFLLQRERPVLFDNGGNIIKA